MGVFHGLVETFIQQPPHPPRHRLRSPLLPSLMKHVEDEAVNKAV
jgi:hypothetical protein